MTKNLLLFTCFLSLTFAAFGQGIVKKASNNQLFASAREHLSVQRDTSDVYFYSFEEGRVMPYYKQNNASEEAKSSLVSVCEGNSVMLTAPDFGEDALYSWKGPGSFTAYSQQIMIERVSAFQAGFYHISIRKNGTTVLGKIKLMVKEKPMAIASGGNFCLGESAKLVAAEAGFGANYKWTQPPSDFSSTSQETTIERLNTGKYLYYLTVSKNGCKSMDTARVEIRQMPMANANNATIREGETATLTAENAGTNANYSWRGPFVAAKTGQTTNINGLKPGKYIYILTVVKNGCSAMNTAVVEVQKNDLKASNSH
jgi:large repetitive protein